MFTYQPPCNMKQSPIYSSLTAAKPAEAIDGSPKDAGGTKHPNVHPVGMSLQFTLQPVPA